jgi:hypothetical protein
MLGWIKWIPACAGMTVFAGMTVSDRRVRGRVDRLAAVVGDRDPAVAPDDHAIRVLRIEPERAEVAPLSGPPLIIRQGSRVLS